MGVGAPTAERLAAGTNEPALVTSTRVVPSLQRRCSCARSLRTAFRRPSPPFSPDRRRSAVADRSVKSPCGSVNQGGRACPVVVAAVRDEEPLKGLGEMLGHPLPLRARGGGVGDDVGRGRAAA
jgi:hypothetical protein